MSASDLKPRHHKSINIRDFLQSAKIFFDYVRQTFVEGDNGIGAMTSAMNLNTPVFVQFQQQEDALSSELASTPQEAKEGDGYCPDDFDFYMSSDLSLRVLEVANTYDHKYIEECLRSGSLRLSEAARSV